MFPSSCVILVPTSGNIDPGCEDGLHELEPRGYLVWRVRGYSAIDAARNQMASDALAQNFQELMWIDSDVVFDPNDVEKLRSYGLPIVCGLYAKKSRREFACAFLPGTQQVQFGLSGGLLEILYCGFGFILTRREVYERMQQQLQLPVCNHRFGTILVPYFAPAVREDAEGTWCLGEDYAFCERVRQSGVRILADTSWTAPLFLGAITRSSRERATYSSGGRAGNAGLDAVHVYAQGFQPRPLRFRVRPPRLGITPLVVVLLG